MSNSSQKSIRRTTYFSGYVQGVGFRYTTVALASRFPVTGTVRNLSDGRVELVAEGTEPDLERFQQAVVENMKTYISDVSNADTLATGEFTTFRMAL